MDVFSGYANRAKTVPLRGLWHSNAYATVILFLVQSYL
jgi:hypothetical protein